MKHARLRRLFTATIIATAATCGTVSAATHADGGSSADRTRIDVPDGNRMFLTIGNITENAQVGLLFIDFSHGSRLRLNGEASVDPEDPLVGEFPGARLVVRVRVRAVFPNCRRYVHTHGPAQRSVFVPVASESPPVPDWKRDEWFDGTLPVDDPALDPTHPSAPSIPRF